MLFHPSSLCLAAPSLACWSRAALTRLLGGPGEHTRVHTRTLGALCRRRGGPKVSPQALRRSSAIRRELLISPGVNAAHSWGWRGGSVRYVRFLLLPVSALAVWPRLSWCERAKRGVRVGSAALVLPSLPPVYSSASPADFLPLCPHTLPLPALREEMSGKCLKSSSEPSAFSTGRHRATGAAWAMVPGSDPPQCRARGEPVAVESVVSSAFIQLCCVHWDGSVPCLSVPFPLVWPEYAIHAIHTLGRWLGGLHPRLCTHHVFPEVSLAVSPAPAWGRSASLQQSEPVQIWPQVTSLSVTLPRSWRAALCGW